MLPPDLLEGHWTGTLALSRSSPEGGRCEQVRKCDLKTGRGRTSASGFSIIGEGGRSRRGVRRCSARDEVVRPAGFHRGLGARGAGGAALRGAGSEGALVPAGSLSRR